MGVYDQRIRELRTWIEAEKNAYFSYDERRRDEIVRYCVDLWKEMNATLLEEDEFYREVLERWRTIRFIEWRAEIVSEARAEARSAEDKEDRKWWRDRAKSYSSDDRYARNRYRNRLKEYERDCQEWREELKSDLCDELAEKAMVPYNRLQQEQKSFNSRLLSHPRYLELKRLESINEIAKTDPLEDVKKRIDSHWQPKTQPSFVPNRAVQYGDREPLWKKAWQDDLKKDIMKTTVAENLYRDIFKNY